MTLFLIAVLVLVVLIVVPVGYLMLVARRDPMRFIEMVQRFPMVRRYLQDKAQDLIVTSPEKLLEQGASQEQVQALQNMSEEDRREAMAKAMRGEQVELRVQQSARPTAASVAAAGTTSPARTSQKAKQRDKNRARRKAAKQQRRR